jgi:hypothetical protein
MRRVHGMKGHVIPRGDLCTSRMSGNPERKKKKNRLSAQKSAEVIVTSKCAFTVKDRTLMLEET